MESLVSQGIDLSAYSTSVNADDAIDLRHALGYAKWDMYGVSYGGKLAQELMRRDPEGTHAVVLLSPGSFGAADDTFTAQRALERVFEACGGQRSCHTAFPTLEEDFYAVFDELSKRPLVVVLDNGPQQIRVSLDGERFLRQMWGQLGDSGNIPQLPLLINELRRGDREAAARRLLGSGVMAPYYPLTRLRNPTRAPDASCLSNVQPIAFATARADPTHVTFVIAPSAGVRTSFAGKWQGEFPLRQSAIFDLETDGTIVRGVLRQQPEGAPSVPLFDGQIEGHTITFKAKTANGQRTIVFIGTLNGDEIAFRREIEERGPPGLPQPGLLGTGSPRIFTAKRMK